MLSFTRHLQKQLKCKISVIEQSKIVTSTSSTPTDLAYNLTQESSNISFLVKWVCSKV